MGGGCRGCDAAGRWGVEAWVCRCVCVCVKNKERDERRDEWVRENRDQHILFVPIPLR